MFDITSSKLFLLAVVALLVIGPKDFPVLLRTIGKYLGIIRGHAKEFRAQFDEAMRESELAELKKDMESIARETEASFNETGRSVEQTFTDARQSVESSVTSPPAPAADPPASADGASSPGTEEALPDAGEEALLPAAPATTAEPSAAPDPASKPEPAPAAERTGA